jgi:hypothetical protein
VLTAEFGESSENQDHEAARRPDRDRADNRQAFGRMRKRGSLWVRPGYRSRTITLRRSLGDLLLQVIELLFELAKTLLEIAWG